MAQAHDVPIGTEASIELRPPRWRWYQFGLRTLLVVTALCAAGAAVWRTCLEPYRRQRQTMALLEQLHGTYKTAETNVSWRRVLGTDLQDVIAVDLANCDDPGAYLEDVAALPRLETLVVGGWNFRDEHLASLKQIATLRRVLLDSTDVTPSAIASLRAAIPGIEIHRADRRAGKLIVERCWSVGQGGPLLPSDFRRAVGEEYDWGYEHLRFRVEVDSGDDLRPLCAMSRLCELSLNGTRASDDALAHVEGLRRVRWIDLAETRIGDEGLAHLTGLLELERLDLAGTRVTDAGLTHLYALQNPPATGAL